MRHQAAASSVNEELNNSEFNNSVEEEPIQQEPRKVVRSDIGNQMSKILVDFEQDDPGEELKLKGKKMWTQPSKWSSSPIRPQAKKPSTKTLKSNTSWRPLRSPSRISWRHQRARPSKKSSGSPRTWWTSKSPSVTRSLFRRGRL